MRWDSTPITLEFDGTSLFEFKNPEGVYLDHGRAAYEPQTNHIVYYGYSDDFTPRQTWEYWDHQWCLLNSGSGPEGYKPVAGMVFVPEFQGLVTVPYDFVNDSLWLYRNHRWELLESDNPHPLLTNPILGYDPKRNQIILFGGIKENGETSKDVWTFGCSNHCRSTLRP